VADHKLTNPYASQCHHCDISSIENLTGTLPSFSCQLELGE